jgi:polysaccharide deacetylase 2 family uncharacterized protein YibQ
MLAVFIVTASYGTANATQYLASIIIDDIGPNYERAHRVATAPIAFTLAILPQTNYAREIANIAHAQGKEVILHLPMQSVAHHKLSPGTLSLHMTKSEFIDQLEKHIAAIPNLKGVNNHMGSLMTRHPGYMNWLMQALADQQGLYFIDSRTTDKSIAAQVAAEHDIPHLQRDIFLDPDFDQHTIAQQFAKFIETVKANGSALAIAHPHPNSTKYILANIHRLKQNGIKLVPVSQLIKFRSQQNHVTCTGTTCAGM